MLAGFCCPNEAALPNKHNISKHRYAKNLVIFYSFSSTGWCGGTRVSLSCKLCAKSNYFSVTQGTHGPRRGLTQKGRPVFIAPEPITYTDNNLINTTYVVRQSFPLFLASLASLSVQHNSLAPFSSPLFSATSADLALKVPAYRHRPISARSPNNPTPSLFLRIQ